jgi:hypothetical protein
MLACVAERPVPARAGLAGLGKLSLQAVEAVDPLLAAARTAIEGGTLNPELRAALLASNDPAHARAQRILLAMEQERLAAPPPSPAPSAHTAPTLRVATAPPEPMPPTGRAAQVHGGGVVAASAAVNLPPPRPQAILRAVGLHKAKVGAVLTLSGSSGLVVGVANQPVSGIVRFVMDATADTRALQARPRVAGARVTGVRRTGKSVFVTVSLQPGWRLGRIHRTGSGARVDLRRPR